MCAGQAIVVASILTTGVRIEQKFEPWHIMGAWRIPSLARLVDLTGWVLIRPASSFPTHLQSHAVTRFVAPILVRDHLSLSLWLSLSQQQGPHTIVHCRGRNGVWIRAGLVPWKGGRGVHEQLSGQLVLDEIGGREKQTATAAGWREYLSDLLVNTSPGPSILIEAKNCLDLRDCVIRTPSPNFSVN